MGGGQAKADNIQKNAMIANSLLTNVNNYAQCRILNRAIVDDGQGGYITQWSDGATFGAAISTDQSAEARVAEVQGVKDVYSVYTDANMVLMYNMVFRRLTDGKIFRVTSDGDDKQTPKGSPLKMRKVLAEEWRLPT